MGSGTDFVGNLKYGVRASLFVFGFRLVSGHPTSVLFPTQ